MNKTATTSRGLGIGSVLTLIFIILKLTGNITWSWFWVVSPMLIGPAILLLLLLFLGIIGVVSLIIGR